MREITDDIWNLYDPRPQSSVWVGITTNGTIKRDGCLVMGRGNALQAKSRIPWIDRRLGTHVHCEGNTVLLMHDIKLFSFPVKAHWRDDASYFLIEESARDLKVLIDCEHHRDSVFYLPRPGCGNGRLKWKAVKHRLDRIELPDNVIIVNRG